MCYKTPTFSNMENTRRSFPNLCYTDQIVSSLLMTGAATVAAECCVAPIRRTNLLIDVSHVSLFEFFVHSKSIPRLVILRPVNTVV